MKKKLKKSLNEELVRLELLLCHIRDDIEEIRREIISDREMRSMTAIDPIIRAWKQHHEHVES